MTESTMPNRTENSGLNNAVRRFAHIFGVGSDYMKEGTSILPSEVPKEKQIGLVDQDQGAILNPASTVGLYWDWEKYDPPSKPILGDISATPVSFKHIEADGTQATIFTSENGASTVMTTDYLGDADELFVINLLEDLEHVGMHPDQDDFPVRVNDPQSERFLLIAPRIVNDR